MGSKEYMKKWGGLQPGPTNTWLRPWIGGDEPLCAVIKLISAKGAQFNAIHSINCVSVSCCFHWNGCSVPAKEHVVLVIIGSSACKRRDQFCFFLSTVLYIDGLAGLTSELLRWIKLYMSIPIMPQMGYKSQALEASDIRELGRISKTGRLVFGSQISCLIEIVSDCSWCISLHRCMLCLGMTDLVQVTENVSEGFDVACKN